MLNIVGNSVIVYLWDRSGRLVNAVITRADSFILNEAKASLSNRLTWRTKRRLSLSLSLTQKIFVRADILNRSQTSVRRSEDPGTIMQVITPIKARPNDRTYRSQD